MPPPQPQGGGDERSRSLPLWNLTTTESARVRMWLWLTAQRIQERVAVEEPTEGSGEEAAARLVAVETQEVRCAQ